MQVEKRGSLLAVRLPVDLIGELGLKEGDQIDLMRDDGQGRVHRLAHADEVLEDLRCFRSAFCL